MKILAFGASNSSKSINKQLATYVAHRFTSAETTILDLNDFPAPIFSVDLEAEQGYPDTIHRFLAHLEQADLIIISLAENNGSYNACFKNLFDWTSRVKQKMFDGKALFLLATSPGPRGASTVLATAQDRFPRHGAILKGTFSLPLFKDNFDPQTGIRDQALNDRLEQLIDEIKRSF